MTYLLDTDHLSILQREQGAEFAALSSRLARVDPSELALSVISFHEQALGCHTYILRARSPADVVRGYEMLVRVLRAFAAAPVLPFDAKASAIFDDLAAHRPRVATMDLRIASIALARGLILLTRNVGDFGKIPGLRTEDWTF
ncbi:type II toxin-antitoxin system VapC family toxin [Tautonia sociabilis]|uniref:Type II toxin-antitoxin system VapC family toxin n=1 Tax=Tautonia sociabilis TaxID=2080755 RepID=A0A432MHE2_9BACT|nr:type II toxin-antitoxin system VapC family toxin [Tautonia sociabilis]RUL86221.1 type II toxin-antitoxin system VapC family toxin [Tautonia sociabilis]